jgi:DnaJ-class molecular chaperone
MDTAEEYELRPCAHCVGPGEPCVACQGAGFVTVLQPCRACSQCGGTGRLRHAEPPWGLRCQSCWGSGWASAVWIKAPKARSSHGNP